MSQMIQDQLTDYWAGLRYSDTESFVIPDWFVHWANQSQINWAIAGGYLYVWPEGVFVFEAERNQSVEYHAFMQENPPTEVRGRIQNKWVQDIPFTGSWTWTVNFIDRTVDHVWPLYKSIQNGGWILEIHFQAFYRYHELVLGGNRLESDRRIANAGFIHSS